MELLALAQGERPRALIAGQVEVTAVRIADPLPAHQPVPAGRHRKGELVAAGKLPLGQRRAGGTLDPDVGRAPSMGTSLPTMTWVIYRCAAPAPAAGAGVARAAHETSSSVINANSTAHPPRDQNTGRWPAMTSGITAACVGRPQAAPRSLVASYTHSVSFVVRAGKAVTRPSARRLTRSACS